MLQIIESKKYFYSCQLTHNKTVIRLEYMICMLTGHGIVLGQAEQFDVLDLRCIIVNLILG